VCFDVVATSAGDCVPVFPPGTMDITQFAGASSIANISEPSHAMRASEESLCWSVVGCGKGDPNSVLGDPNSASPRFGTSTERADLVARCCCCCCCSTTSNPLQGSPRQALVRVGGRGHPNEGSSRRKPCVERRGAGRGGNSTEEVPRPAMYGVTRKESSPRERKRERGNREEVLATRRTYLGVQERWCCMVVLFFFFFFFFFF